MSRLYFREVLSVKDFKIFDIYAHFGVKIKLFVPYISYRCFFSNISV